MSETAAPQGATGGMVRVELQPLPKWKTELRVRFLGNPNGLLVHHRHRQIGVPCGQAFECKMCRQRHTPRWKGYTSVIFADKDSGMWLPAVIEITEGLKPIFDGRDLRGEEWCLCIKEDRFHRWPGQARRSVNVVPERLPEPIDVLQWCKWFYNDPDLEMEATVRRPPQILAAPVAIKDAAPVVSVPIQAHQDHASRPSAPQRQRSSAPEGIDSLAQRLIRQAQERERNGHAEKNGNGKH